jgi:hypothetical protein
MKTVMKKIMIFLQSWYCLTVLGSQLFSGFWIGWMIEHPTKSNSENPRKLDFQSKFIVKNPIMLDFQSTFIVINPKNLDFWIFVELLDRIELKKSNPIK